MGAATGGRAGVTYPRAGQWCRARQICRKSARVALFRGLQEQPVPMARAVVPARKALRCKAFRRHRTCRWRRLEAYGGLRPPPRDFSTDCKDALYRASFFCYTGLYGMHGKEFPLGFETHTAGYVLASAPLGRIKKRPRTFLWAGFHFPASTCIEIAKK